MQVKEYDAQPPPKVAKDRLHLLDAHGDLGGMAVSELEALHATVDEELEARFDGHPLQRKALASGHRPTDRGSCDMKRPPGGGKPFGRGRSDVPKRRWPTGHEFFENREFYDARSYAASVVGGCHDGASRRSVFAACS